MNKRGDVPITILVIGVFVVCSLALLTFFMYDFRMSNSFVGISIMEKMNSAIDEYTFYVNNGIPMEKAQNYFNVKEEGGKKYLYYEKSYYDSFLGLSKKYVLLFSVKYPLP